MIMALSKAAHSLLVLQKKIPTQLHFFRLVLRWIYHVQNHADSSLCSTQLQALC